MNRIRHLFRHVRRGLQRSGRPSEALSPVGLCVRAVALLGLSLCSLVTATVAFDLLTLRQALLMVVSLHTDLLVGLVLLLFERLLNEG